MFIFTAIAGWWKSMSWTTRITLIVVILVVGTIGIQYTIIQRNQSKIDDLQSQITALQLDVKLQALQTKIDNIRTAMEANAAVIEAHQAAIADIRAKVYKKPYKPDPNMKAAQIVEGFKALQNETP